MAISSALAAKILVLLVVRSVYLTSQDSEPCQIALLRRVQPDLPPGVRVNFYGDGEFRAVPLQQTCQSYGWHWQVGLKFDIYFWPSEGDWQPLRNLNLQPGQRCYVQEVYLT